MSGRKDFRSKYILVSAGDMSQATVTSAAVGIHTFDNIGIQVNITAGTPTGAFDVQVSADHNERNGQIITAGTWISIGTAYTATITSGSPSNVYFDLNQLSSQFVRLLYTKTSGTGTFDAFLVGKML